MWFGYARSELLTGLERAAVSSAMHDYATYFALGPGRVVIEPAAPERVLRALLEDLDHCDPAAAVRWRLERIAASRDIDLARVLDADSPRTQVLWQVMEEIEGHGRGHLIVPSRAHLTGLGASGRAVVQRLTRMPQAHVYFLDSATATDVPARVPLQGTSDAPRPGERVLVESSVGAVPTVTRFDMVEALTRRGWPELIEVVDAVYVALVDDANTAANAAGEVGLGLGELGGVIRLVQRDDGQLVVELDESRHRDDDLVAALTALCAHAERFADRGHTITRCTLPSEYTLPVAVPVECSGR
ncbi:hypothetical protein [Nocardia sp. R7R-8]|uniref:hypothetical protein n=1 Tax=Nocardia sp. R7R-8 TaxID=3459304 RepID=UPI00403DF98E